MIDICTEKKIWELKNTTQSYDYNNKRNNNNNNKTSILQQKGGII